MGASYTPGPWTIKRSPGGRKVHISGGHWFKFARVWVSVMGETSDEGLANAGLIVAAPDLLEAAKLALDEMQRTIATRDAFTDAVDALDAAIAKAEGRS